MSDGEQKLADQAGKFAQVVKDGRKVNDIEWLTGRLILSNKRLVLVSSEGKQTLALAKIQSIKNRKDVDQPLAQVSGYFSLQSGKNVFLVSPQDENEFELELYTALLDQEVALIKHPAVKGGVVQDNPWGKGRIKIEADQVGLAVASGQFVEIELEDVGLVELNEKTVNDDQRRVLEVEHTVSTTSVETHISGRARHVTILESLVRQGEQQNQTDVELSDEENEVLMALYSGVSPFQIPDFVGMEVGEIEEIFDRLVEAGILEEVRVRRDVELKARGRNIASEVISDQ
jgi:helix-turn-helix protein